MRLTKEIADALNTRHGRPGSRTASSRPRKRRRRYDAKADLHTQLKAAGVPWPRCASHPDGELRFHPVRQWRFDYAWPRSGEGLDRPPVALELEGSVWEQGRHTRGAGFSEDIVKYNEAALLGWKVIRCTPDHVKSGQALTWVLRALGGELALAHTKIRNR